MQEMRKWCQRHIKTNRKESKNSSLSVIPLNENGLDSPIKRLRLAEWILEKDANTCFIQKTQFRSKETNKLEVKRWK